MINAAELATYDQVKQFVLSRNLLQDGVPCHLSCGFVAGVVAVIFGSPMDVLKTRMMQAPMGMYRNPLDCVIKTLRNEGFFAFYKGFGPNVVRLSSWVCIMFLTLEQVKKRMG